MVLIILTLSILMVITVLSLIAGNSFVEASMEGLIDSNALINGTTTTFEMTGTDTLFFIDPVQGAIIMLIAIFVIGAVIGLNVVGTGLNETSSRAVMYGLFYVGIWVILSVLAYPLIVSIELFGTLIYTVLTLLFTVGVVQKYLGAE